MTILPATANSQACKVYNAEDWDNPEFRDEMLKLLRRRAYINGDIALLKQLIGL